MNYDKFVTRMWKKPLTFSIELYLTTAFCGEAGEVANAVKKLVRDCATKEEVDLQNELGDCLYYLTALAHYYEWTLQDIMQANIEKLESRHKER